MKKTNTINKLLFISGWVLIAANKLLDVTIGLNKFMKISISLLAIICFITYIFQLRKYKK